MTNKYFNSKRVNVINNLINIISLNRFLKIISDAKKFKLKKKYICISNIHSCVESYKNKQFVNANNNSFITFPDSRILYLILKILGHKRAEYLSGWELTEKICKIAESRKLNVGILGGDKNTQFRFISNVKKRNKKLKILYSFSPSFIKQKIILTKNEINKINKLKIDILFVCLGCPKQEIFMNKYSIKIKTLMIGIGAAIDFVSGVKITPPKIIHKIGLGWLFRLLSEPKRLFYRYTVTNFLFIYLFFLQITGIKKFK